MSDIINSVKEEILRLADKQAAAQISKAQQVASQYRKQVAELRRLVKQRKRRSSTSRSRRRSSRPEDPSWRAFATRRSLSDHNAAALGLSCEQYAKLVGVSTLTIQNWESGKSRPRRQQLLALVAVRGISKRAALAKLAELEP